MSDMDGIVLSRAEFLELMAAANADTLIGIDDEQVLPNSKEEHQRLVLEGIEQLKERSLIHMEDDIHVINEELLLIGRIVAVPDLFFQITKHTPGLGRQDFLYYQYDRFIVEHTMPEPDRFRFATIPNTLALLNRVEFLLPLSEDPPEVAYDQRLEQEVFIGVQWLVERGDLDDATYILTDNDLSPEAAELLVGALNSPEFSGIVGMMRCQEGAITDGREMRVIIGEGSSWLMQLDPPGGDILRLQMAHAELFRVSFIELLQNLVEPA